MRLSPSFPPAQMCLGTMPPCFAIMSVRMNMSDRRLGEHCLLKSGFQGLGAGCRRVMQALAEQEVWPPHKWVYDGQKILYVAGDGVTWLKKQETVYEVGTASLLSLLLTI